MIPISDGEERRLLDPNPERGFSFSADDGGSLVGHEYTMHCVAVYENVTDHDKPEETFPCFLSFQMSFKD